MLTTPHLIVGAAIGASFQNPLLVAPAAAASHFVLDSIPHLMGIVEVEDFDKKDAIFILSDIALGIGLLFILTKNNPQADMMLLGAFCAMLPDFHHTYQLLFGPDKLEKYDRWHLRFHYKKPMKLLPGFATQLVTILFAIILIKSRV